MRILMVLIALVFAGCGGASDDSTRDKAAQEVREAGSVGEEAVEENSEGIADGYHDSLQKAEDVERVLKEAAENVDAAIEEATGD